MSAVVCLHFRVTSLLVFLPVAVLNSYPAISRGHSTLDRYVVTTDMLLTDDELQCSHWNASSAKPKPYLNTCSLHYILISWNRTYILPAVTVPYCVFFLHLLAHSSVLNICTVSSILFNTFKTRGLFKYSVFTPQKKLKIGYKNQS